MPPAPRTRRVCLVMYARAVDDASARLRELRQDEWQDLGLAALALGLAAVAAEVRPTLALPLFLAGLVVGALGAKALWRRWDLVERLSGERDAYVISEVRAYASREATMERRHTFAALIRSRLADPGLAVEGGSARRRSSSRRWHASSRTETSRSTPPAPLPVRDC